jgi:multidrug efflux pump subunit AcrA (membrane-fusion protein)
VRPAAGVSSINALGEFRRCLAEFQTTAIAALDEAQADVQRAVWWVQHEQLTWWQGQKKKRTAKLAQAQSELFRAEVASPDLRVRPTAERKAVEDAQRALAEAETRLASIKRWSVAIEREVLLYKAQCQHLAQAVEGDLPRALVRLDRMVASLERYVRLAVPTDEPPAAAPPEPAGGGPEGQP